MDRVWYHPLLKAAVEHGTRIEDEIKKHLPQAGMTATITGRSQKATGRIFGFLRPNTIMHSEQKLNWFYGVGAAAFIISAVALQIGAVLKDDPADKPQRMDVRIVEPGPSAGAGAPQPAPSATPGVRD